VGVSPDDTTVYVAGTSWTMGGNVYLTIAYDAATGAPAWTSDISVNVGESPVLQVDPDGTKVFVAGGDSDYGAWALDASTGTMLWGAGYDGLAHGNDQLTGTALSGDGTRVYLTGESNAGTPAYGVYATVSLNATTGGQQWAELYDGPPGASDSAL